MRLWIAGAARPFYAREKYTAPRHGVRKIKGIHLALLDEEFDATKKRVMCASHGRC